MDTLTPKQITKSNLTEWRSWARDSMPATSWTTSPPPYGLSPPWGEAGDALHHHPRRVTMGDGYVDLKVISDDAIYRDDEGTEHVVEWVTPRDVDLARRITEIAAEQKVEADPASIMAIELGLDTANSATIAPVWAAVLTGSTDARAAGQSATTYGTPRNGFRSCGSGTSTSTRPRDSGSTSRSTWASPKEGPVRTGAYC
jgi:4a-hydroxytetrahydrobiopterin dehydratase